MQKASLSLEANPLEIHVHDFITIEVLQITTEELPTEKKTSSANLSSQR